MHTYDSVTCRPRSTVPLLSFDCLGFYGDCMLVSVVLCNELSRASMNNSYAPSTPSFQRCLVWCLGVLGRADLRRVHADDGSKIGGSVWLLPRMAHCRLDHNPSCREGPFSCSEVGEVINRLLVDHPSDPQQPLHFCPVCVLGQLSSSNDIRLVLPPTPTS
jgi:hypothetical protein